MLSTVKVKGIPFEENTFREIYNEWMGREKPKLPVESIGMLEKYEILANRNIVLDFANNDINCLEIGCANGQYVLGLKKAGLISKGKGIDVSSLMIDFAKQTAVEANMDIEFECISFENFQAEEKYDIVAMFQTLEHFVDHGQALTKVKNLLKPGGFFYGAVPEDHTCDAEVHLNYYTMDSLHKLLLGYFKRITIISIDLYEGVVNHFPEIHFFFRCQRSLDA